MRTTKKLTLSAAVVALGTVFMTLGAFVDVLDLTVCALASLLVAFVFVEIGSPYTWLVWLTTSLLSFLFFPAKTVWILYLFVFGIYPILKAYIERLPRFAWFLIKLPYINGILWVLILTSEKLFGVPFFETDLFGLKAGIYVFLNAAFLAYDFFITVLVRFYFERLRHRFKNLLK